MLDLAAQGAKVDQDLYFLLLHIYYAQRNSSSKIRSSFVGVKVHTICCRAWHSFLLKTHHSSCTCLSFSFCYHRFACAAQYARIYIKIEIIRSYTRGIIVRTSCSLRRFCQQTGSFHFIRWFLHSSTIHHRRRRFHRNVCVSVSNNQMEYPSHAFVHLTSSSLVYARSAGSLHHKLQVIHKGLILFDCPKNFFQYQTSFLTPIRLG